MKAVVRKTARVQHRPAPRSNERRLVTQHPRRRILIMVAGAAGLPAASRMTWAQAYPTRPIKIVVPYAPGGSGDVIARNLAERMRASLGQPVVIGRPACNQSESVHRKKGGASGRPQGSHRLVEGQSGQSIDGDWRCGQSSADRRHPFPKRNGYPLCIRALSRRSASHPGFGRGAHRPDDGRGYRCLPQLRVGNIKAYAVTAKTRLAAAPNIPTVDEAGLPGFYASFWQGFWVPKRTPNNILAKLNTAVVQALADPGVRARLSDLGQEIFPRDQQTPEALRALQKAEIEKWWPIIKAANLKGE